MYLYNLTLQKPNGIYQSISGSFTAPKTQEIVISKGTILELFQVDQSGKLKTLISKETFCQIRNISPFRLTGNKRDHIIVLSDSGRIVILEADITNQTFTKIHQETYGKTGCRRIVPGEYIAVDPRGRAIMIGAVEKQKFVYIINRDSESRMTISSPLEAHKSHTICYGLCGLDVGYENPMFASLEVDYGEEDDDKSSLYTGNYQKLLVYYEMELSLNHVVRKKYEKVDFSAHLLVPVFKTAENPGGIFVFCDNFVEFKGLNNIGSKIAYYPQRYENEHNTFKKQIMIINYSIYKRKELFFVLAQSEFGDLFKITLDFNKGKINDIIIQYFDTIPPANSISLLINGYLFSASETSNHYLYSLISLDVNKEQYTSHALTSTKYPLYNPTELTHLHLIDEINSLSCITDMVIQDLVNEGEPQIYTLCGKGPRSSLRVLRPGLNINNIVTSNLPGEPIAIWTIKADINDEYDKYIVVSFINATLVLGISDKISEITNSGFDAKNPSIHVGILNDNSFIQVISTGIIHIMKDKKSFLKANSKIKCACSNSKQVIIGLENNEMLYFEHDNKQLCKPDIKVLDKEIICVDLSPIMEGRTRSKYVSVGCGDKTIRIFSLEIEQCLAKISLQVLPFDISSLKFISHNNKDNLYLYIGLSNGVLIKTSVDTVTGMQTDMQTKYLGTLPVKLYQINNQGEKAILACSSKPYLCYKYMGKYYSEMINLDTIEYATPLNSEVCPEGIITIKGEALQIFSINNLNDKFSSVEVPLRYTPRKMMITKEKNIIVIEADQHSYSNYERGKFKEKIVEISKDSNYSKLKDKDIGSPYTAEGNWGSCIRIISPINNMKTIDLIEFEENEAAISSCLCSFLSSPNDTYLIVGTAKDLKLLPHRSYSSANIVVFLLKENGTKIEFVFKQPIDDIALAFCEYQGKLLAGIGSNLVLYELGKAHLLKKCETKKITSTITQIQTNGQRILVSTMNESFYFLRHKISENQFYIFADDVIPRWITTSIFLDYDTIAGSDKFENFFIYRLPPGADEESSDDPMGTKKKWEVGYLHGAAYKLNLIAQYHLGDLITSMQKTSFHGENENVICFGTTSGKIGVFLPFETREEVDFFVHLEMYERIEIDNIAGRDHQMFRSCYGPVKCVIDGDLCEEFMSLEGEKRKSLASELDKNENDIINKLEDMRNKII